MSDPHVPVRAGSPGPGPGAGLERDPERAAIVIARIALVAMVVIGQLWALTVALNAYFEERMSIVWWLVVFEVISFVIALGIWLMARGDR
jgi:cytochrome bd-type quinol oxidase subunit 2